MRDPASSYRGRIGHQGRAGRRVALALATLAALLSSAASPAQYQYRQVDSQLMRRYRDANALFEKARAAFARRDLDATLEKVDACLKRIPEHADAHLLKAKVLYSRQEYPLALTEVERAESGYVATAGLIERMRQDNLSALRRQRQTLEDGIRELEVQITLVSPEQAPLLRAKLQRAVTDAHDIDRLLGEPFPASGQVPAEYHFFHGNVLYRLGRHDEAAGQYALALATDPAYSDAANNLIGLLSALGRRDKAAAALAEAEAHGVKVIPELKASVATAAVAPDAPRPPGQPVAGSAVAAPRPIAEGPVGAAAQSEAEPTPEAPPDDLRRAYLAALGALSGSDTDPAEVAVAGLEVTALAADSPGAAKRLLAAELAVARELGRRQPDALLALLHIHARLATRFGVDRNVLAQGHAWTMALELAALVAHTPGDVGRTRAGDAVACMAGVSKRVGAHEAAEHQLRIALAIDPANAAALEGLSAALEGEGRYPETARLLERLLALRPDSFEVKLRLAVTRARLGDGAEAEPMLRACTVASAPTWVRAVAWQELVRGPLAAGRWEEAVLLLAVASQALPDDRELAVMHAFVLDRTGHRAQARAIADRLTSRPGERQSARFTYSQLPSAELDRSCQAVSTAVRESAAPALARALTAEKGATTR